MGRTGQLNGKSVLVAGGSSGLGKEIAKVLVTQGANVTIFARHQGQLDVALRELLALRCNTKQSIDAISLDLADPIAIHATFKALPMLPDIVYCVAGGTANEIGFLTDIEPEDLETCMRNNYYTAAYVAQATLKLWTADDSTRSSAGITPVLRQIVFINSAAAFLGLPGYAAYTPSKCAVRGLADVLRLETMRLSNAASRYTIHCAFPANFISPAFLAEQPRKPALTKQLEGTDDTIEKLTQSFPATDKIAQGIVRGVDRGDFALCDDSFETKLLFANMVGPSPKRGVGIFDSVMGVVMGLFVWPITRRRWERKCIRDGEQARQVKV